MHNIVQKTGKQASEERLESSSRLLDALAQGVDDLVDHLLVGKERRRQGNQRASGANEHTLVEAAIEDVDGALVGHRSSGDQLHRTHQTDVADVDHVGQTLERVDGLLEVGSQLVGALEQVLLLEDLQGSDTCSHSQRMTTVGVAMEELHLSTGGSVSLSLDGIEEKIALILDISSQVMAILSDVDPRRLPEAQQLCAEFYSSIRQIQTSLSHHIRTTFVPNIYKKTCYGDFHRFRSMALANEALQQKLSLLVTQSAQPKEELLHEL